MPQTIKSTDPNALQKLDTFLGQFRHEAAHSNRPWELQYDKDDTGSVLTIQLAPPEKKDE